MIISFNDDASSKVYLCASKLFTKNQNMNNSPFSSFMAQHSDKAYKQMISIYESDEKEKDI